MEQIVVVASMGLLSGIGAPMRREESSSSAPPRVVVEPADWSLATITFSGSSMQGTLMLLSTFSFLAGCRPGDGRAGPLSSKSAGDWIFVRDWTKELANQLLGRIKSQVLAHGLTFDSGAPNALTGPALTKAVSAQAAPPIRFASTVERVSVWLDVKLTPDAESKLLSRGADLKVKEGDIVLF